MTETEMVAAEAGRVSAAAPASENRGDWLWGAGLSLAVVGIFIACLFPGLLGWILGLSGLGLGVAAGLLELKRARRVSVGAIVAIAASLFTAIIGGRPAQPPTIALKDAPKLRAPSRDGVEFDDQVTARGVALASEAFFHPGPVALGFGDLLPLAASQLRPSGLVAAAWDGAWFAGNIVSLAGDRARVHFIGWEGEWDVSLPTGELRGLIPTQVPRPPAPDLAALLGRSQAEPGDFTLKVFQPAGGLADGGEMAALAPVATLFASRLDVSEAPLAQALPNLQASDALPLGLLAEGAVHFAEAGSRYFAVSSDGSSKLWLDGELVDPTKAVSLDAGVHQLKLEYRHPPGAKLSLALKTGTNRQALRVLDLKRDGVAQSARESDGALRVVLAEGILFDFDKDELKPSSERALSAIYASTIAPAPTTPVRVEGHTDDRGSDEHNLDLSLRRAERVRGWLVAHGRSEAGSSVRALGEKKPRVPNDSDAHRSANRRVELVIGGSSAPSEPSPDAPTLAPAAAGAAAPNRAEQPVVDLLHRYYQGLNSGSFDANQYFEPNIERYITMMSTSTRAVNHYILKVFPTQFKQPHFELEEGSLTAEAPGQYVYVEHSRYVLAKKTEVSDRRARVRIRLSPGGKLVFLHQFQRL